MKIAIVIPYYNPYFFEATLLSLVAQTNQRFRVYIGDDGSPHNPNTVLSKFKENLPFTYKRFNSNIGRHSLVQHWDRCMDLITDEPWVMILGDDDVLGPHVISSFYDNLNEINVSGISVVRFASCVIDADGVKISKVYAHPTLEPATEAYYKNFKNEGRSSLSEYIFSREAYITHGFKNYPLAWYSDTMAWLEFSNFGMIYSINTSVVYVRTSPYSITGTSDNYLLKYQSGYQFFKDVLSFKPRRFTNTQRYDFILTLQGLIFKLNLLDVSHWFLVVGYWIKGLYLKQAIRFTLIFFKRTFIHG